jgi:hypothetical protein
MMATGSDKKVDRGYAAKWSSCTLRSSGIIAYWEGTCLILSLARKGDSAEVASGKGVEGMEGVCKGSSSGPSMMAIATDCRIGAETG